MAAACRTTSNSRFPSLISVIRRCILVGMLQVKRRQNHRTAMSRGPAGTREVELTLRCFGGVMSYLELGGLIYRASSRPAQMLDESERGFHISCGSLIDAVPLLGFSSTEMMSRSNCCFCCGSPVLASAVRAPCTPSLISLGLGMSSRPQQETDLWMGQYSLRRSLMSIS